MTDLSDCLRRIAEHGDQRAFAALFTETAPRVKAYMMRRGADAATAEELAQEALAIAWTRAASFDPRQGGALAWLFAIARNLRIDRYRRERVWRVTEGLPDDHAETATDAATSEDAVLEREVTAQVRAVLATLPDDQREIVELSFVTGLSHSEIKARTGLPLGTIKSRLRLAYDRLRPVLTALRRL